MATPAIQTLLTDAQQVLNLNSLSEVRSTMAAALANANVGTPLNPNLTTQQLWDEFYLIVRQPESDIESIITNQLMKFLFAPPAPGGAGANHEVIYNNNGVLAGDSKFLWDDALNKLDIDGSATISGDLTVDTNVLKVVSASDTVGIRTATPNDVLEVVGSGANGLRISRSGLPGQYTTFSAGATGQTIDAAAVIGVITFGIGGSEQMRLNSAGNVGVGVTPKSWLSSYKAIQLGYSTSLSSTTGTDFAGLSSNAYVDSVDSRWERIVSGYATQYYQNAGDGQHIWRIAGTAAADTAITWTNAMTLAANGQLLLGTSSTSGAVDIGMVMNKPSASGFVGTVYRLDNVDKAYTYIASAAAALRIDTVAGYTVNVISGGTNGVYLANGGVAWLALSDERFKDIIEPISNAVAKVGSLRSVIGKFKSEAEGTRRPFLFAQDVQAVLPEAVDATKPEQLGLSYTEVIPLLVAAIKELSAEVNALKNA